MKLIKNPELNDVPIVEGGGYVYIIETDKDIKIGRSKNLKQRINAIKTTSGKKVLNIYITPACSNYCFIENEMHKIFKEKRIIGEWFNVKVEDALHKLDSFEFIEPTRVEKENIMFFNHTNIAMEHLKKNEPIIYKFLKDNNYNVFYDEKEKNIYIEGFDNDEYFEMLFELFIRLYITKV